MDRKKIASNAARKDAQLAARLASLGIVVGFVIYWWNELQAVREMLELAYG
ncbi:MAG: hypothetical protein Hals2KO_37770 [Halioglobus sp.]